MNTKDNNKQKQNTKNNNEQEAKRPPLPEPNLFKDGVGMYDFHGDKDEKTSEWYWCYDPHTPQTVSSKSGLGNGGFPPELIFNFDFFIWHFLQMMR